MAILRERGITVPFPQRDLHLRGENLELRLPSELEQTLMRLRGQQPGRPPESPG